MAPITWNQQVVKKNNKSLVLQMIMEQEPISRADIAQITGLNKATVSSLVSELLKEELIYESGPGESSGGRRPVLLHFNKFSGYSIGIDIGVNYILTILTDLKGGIVFEKNLPISDTSYSSVVEQVKSCIRLMLNGMPKSRYGVIGIGIGVPGLIDTEGTVLIAPNLGWKNVFLKSDIESEFKIPVCLENEANAGAYGEKQFGIDPDTQDFIYISAGIGIGVGIIVNGELYRGKSGLSGEMGHMIIDLQGRQCSCGSKGCWETYASESALLKAANKENATLELLIEAAENNDKEAIRLFEEIGRYLGYGINNIINTFNPAQVTIGNRLAMAKEWLEEPIRKTIETHALSLHQSDFELHFSKLSIYPAAMGASAFAVEQFIKEEEKRPHAAAL